MMQIREAQLKDAPECAKVHTYTWQTAYRGIIPEEYLQRLSIEKKTEQWIKMFKIADRDYIEVAYGWQQIQKILQKKF